MTLTQTLTPTRDTRWRPGTMLVSVLSLSALCWAGVIWWIFS